MHQIMNRTVFVDVDAIAERYQISARHWHRMVAAGKCPKPLRLNRLVRWRLSDLEEWEAAGCPRSTPRKGAK